MIDDIKKVCSATIASVIKKSKEEGYIQQHDLDNLEQVSRILKNLSAIPVAGDDHKPIDLSTRELIEFVRSSKPGGQA